MKLILASKSPRRKELLTKYGFSYEVCPAVGEEIKDETKTALENVESISYQKAQEVFLKFPEDVILSCDTIVVLDNVIYGKPKSREDAYNTLNALSGRTHEVISSVTIMSKEKTKTITVTSYVTFKELDKSDIDAYLDTNEPYDKAGSYAIQGIGSKLIQSHKGSLNNIIGLPIEDIIDTLKEFGVNNGI